MPEIDNESRKWLYQTLTSPEYGLNLGTPQEFDSLMTNNEESRKWLWEQANSFGLNVGANYDEFNSLVNPAPQRTDVSDVQQAEQANAPVAEVATQPQQEAIPTATMEQVDNVGHYQPRSGAELKTPEQLEAEVQNSLPTPTTENEPKPQEVHGENLSGFAYPFNKGLMHEDPNRNDGNFIGNVINNPQKGGKEDASSVELNNAYAATGDQPYELPTELNEVGYNEVLQKKNALIAEKKQIEKRGNMMLDTDIEPSWAERDRNRAKIIEAELDKVLKYEYSYLRTPEGQAYLDRYDEMCDQMDAAIKEAGGDNYSWQGRLGEAFANTSPTDIKSLTPEEEQRQKDMAEYGNKLIKAKRDVKNVRREVRKTRERLNGDYSGFRRGWRATDVEGLSGINDFADKMTQLELAKKVREGKPLDKVDEVLLRANELKSTSDMNLATSDTMWEHIGSSTAEQLVTTAEFLAGSYLTGATDISGKVAGRVMSSMGSKAAEEAVVSSARNLLRAGVAEVAGMAAGAAVQTFANPLSYLSMMADYADKRTGTIYYDQNDGQLHYFDNNKSIALSLWQAAAGAYIENFTEFSGEGIDKIGKLGLNKLFSAAPELKSATETIKGLLDKVKFSELSGLNAPAMDDFLRHAGFNGTLGEFGEEVLGNIIRPFAYVETEKGESYGKQLGRGLKNLVDADQNLETFLSCAITSAVLGTVGTVRRTASDMITNSQQKAYDEQLLKDVRDNIAKLDAMMNGVRGLDKEAFKEFIANNNVSDISQYIKEQAKANNWTSDELGMVALYVTNVAQQNAMANQNSEAIQQSIDALNEQTKQLVNEWDGEHIYNVTFKDPKTGEELHGSVVNGRMHYTQNDDGTYNFNPYVSSGMLAIRMEDGSVRQVSSRAVTSLDNVTTATEQNANQGQIVREMMEDQFEKDELMPTVESAWGFEFEPGATEIDGLTFVGKDKDGNYQFQMGSNANRVVKMSEEQVISWGLRQGISLMQQQAANGQLLKDISADVQKMSDDADLMDEIDQLKQQNTRGVTAHDLWKQVIDVTSKFVSIDENGLYDEDNTSPNDAAVDLYARAEGNVAAAKENVAKAKAALMSASEQGSLAAVGAFTGSALANQEAQVQSDEATTRAAKQIAFLEQVENVLDQMGARAQQLAENDAKEEAVKVSSTPVSQMEVGQQFPVEWRGQQAMATVMGKDADGRSVVTVRDMDGEDIEAGIDDMSDAQWEAVRVQPQEATAPEQVPPQVPQQVEPQQEVPQAASQSEPQPQQEAQQEPRLPRDKDGNIDYEQITDPALYAQGLLEEFGDEAIDTINELIAEENENYTKATEKKNAIERRRAQKESQGKLDFYYKVKDALAPQERVETPEQPNEEKKQHTPIKNELWRDKEGDLYVLSYVPENILGQKDVIRAEKYNGDGSARFISLEEYNSMRDDDPEVFIDGHPGHRISELPIGEDLTLDNLERANNVGGSYWKTFQKKFIEMLSGINTTDELNRVRKEYLEGASKSLRRYIENNIINVEERIAGKELYQKDEFGDVQYDDNGKPILITDNQPTEQPEQPEQAPEQPAESVPDWTEDTAKAARERGYRMVDGERVDRQEPIDGVEGNEVEVKFSDTEKPKGKWKVVEAESLQPSHLNKRRNPRFFITEAQPKERKDNASDEASTKIAKDINPDEVMQGVTAYSGSPVINSRGEVIQGNNRTIGLQKMYESYPESQEKYKQALMDKAEQMGLDKDAIGKMQHPVLVRSVDVDDDTAIKLGQKTSQDTESGGKQRMGASQVRNSLGDKYANLIEMLFADTTEDEGIGEAIARNGVTALKYLWNQKVINNTQYQSALENGDLTAEAKEDFRNIIMESLFEGGPDGLRTAFNMLPSKSQNAILQTIYRDAKSNDESKIKGEVQQAIMAFANLMGFKSFAAAKNQTDVENAVNSWLGQQNMFSDVANTEKYSNFALELAKRFKWQTLTGQRAFFNELYDKLQGLASEGLSMFEEVQQLGLAEAIKAVYGIDYLKPQQNNGIYGSNVVANDNGTRQEGEQGRTGETESGERAESGERPADDRGGDERTGREGQKDKGREITLDEIRNAWENGFDGVDEETLDAYYQWLLNNANDEESNRILDDMNDLLGIEDEAEEEEAPTEETPTSEEPAPKQEKKKTKEQIEQERRDDILSLKDPLTEEEIRNSSEDEIIKENALSYLNGDRGVMAANCYLIIYDNVRNVTTGAERSGSTTDQTQLDAEDNGDKEPGESRQGGRGTGELGGEPSDTGRQGDGQEDNNGGVADTDGEGSLQEVEGNKPQKSNNPSSNPSRRGGSRGNRGASVDGNGGREVGREDSNANADDGGENTRDSLQDALDEFGDLLDDLTKENQAIRRRNQGILYANPIGANMSMEKLKIWAKLTVAGAKVGYELIKKGITKFADWSKQMNTLLSAKLTNAFGWDKDGVDQYILELWNSKLPIDGETHTVAEWASIMGKKKIREAISESREVKAEKQAKAENIEAKPADIDNINATLPFLLPEQRDDVLKAETQFFTEAHQDREHGYGKGYLFTNGTGTGKTYTGLGIIKRFVKMGKGRVLLVVPSEKKESDWINSGKNLLLDIHSLRDDKYWDDGKSSTQRSGKGIVVTTDAAFRENFELLKDNFDLVVYDESHRIMSSNDANSTRYLDHHFMLTLKDAEAATQRAIAVSPEMEEHRANAKELDTIRKALAKNERLKNKIESGNGTQSDLDKLLSEQEENDLMHRAQQLDFRNASIIADIEARKSEFEQKGKAFMDAKQPKVVFLSATPFNTVDSMKYAEGYIFSYPEGDKNGELFKTQYFPSSFQSRHGKVQQSVVDAVQAEREEINFSERLQHELETMSGRIIENGYDYSRHFPTLTNEYATMFNEAVQRITSFPGYQPLYKAMYDTFLKGAGFAPALLETLKVALVIPRIKQHIAMGRKVVVFHRRRNSQEPPSPPFERMLNKAMMEATTPQERAAVKSAVDQFRKEFSQLLAYEQTLNYDMILKQFSDEFGNQVAFFNGDVKETEQENSEEEKKNISSIDAFNQHNGKTKIIVVQEASGKEGIDLHDTFGDEMRVEINLSLPQNPLTMLQIMGRIFRIGQKSNAVFEYPLIGLDFELMTFGSNMNQAVGTAENLALGDLSRGLRQALANGVLEHSGEVPLEGQGVGGVEYDRRSQEEGSYEKAMSDYYKAKAQKFPDTNATPEALGYKMVEWAGLGESDEVLEPSAGHGAIARYVPQGNSLTAIEPNISLMAGLQLRASGRTRDFKNQTFEALDIINKYNIVLMNSQHQGQSSGSADIVKAYQHLREGGRMVVVSNDEAVAMAKSKMPNAVLVGKVKLPSFTFGDNVADENGKVVNDYSKANVYIFDIASRNETREEAKKKYKEVDLSDAKNIGELFANLKDVKMPERTIDDAAIDTLNAGKTWPRFKKLTRVFWEEQSSFTDTAMRVFARTVGKKAYRYTKKLDIEYKSLRNNPRQAIRLYQEFKDSFNDYDNMAREYAEQEARGEKVNKQRVEWTGEMADFCELSMRTILNVMRVNSEEQLIRLAEEHEANKARLLREAVQNIVKNASQTASSMLNNAAKDSGIRPYIQDYLEANDDYSKRSMRNSLTYQLRKLIYGELNRNYLEPKGYIWGDVDWKSKDEIESLVQQEVDDYINRIDNGFDPLNVKENISDFEKEKEYDIEDIRQYFYNLIGDNKDLRTLFDKVAKVSSMFGYKFKFTDMLDKQPSVMGDTNFTGLIRLKDSLFRQGADKTKQANVILHEMIHSSLIYATLIRTYDKAKYPTLGLFMDNLAQRMSPEMNEAVDELLSLFNTLKIDKRFTRRDGGLEDYGAFTPDEMIAELANPMFRAKLKAKRVWKKVVNAIAKFFGAQTKEAEESDALVELEKILDKFLNNADKSLYNDVKNMLQLGGYANESLNFRDQEREYEFGEMLPITQDFNGYRVEGLNDSYPNLDRLLDAWRDEHLDYFAEIRNDKLYVEPWNLPEPKTAKEKRYLQKSRERAWRNMHTRADDTIKKLGLQDRVTILDSTKGLEGKKKTAKGWFDPATGKIVIVMPNHRDPHDVMKTILHEGVAHYGLRQLVGNDNMNEFLDKVFEHASKDVRDRIIDLAMNKYNRNIRKATEEYLAGLAESTNFEDAKDKDWFKKIKAWFMQMLHKVGIDFGNFGEAVDNATFWGDRFTDNELRYLLWKSYRNLVADAESRTELARDVMMQSQLGVGNYAPTVAAESMAREGNDDDFDPDDNGGGITPEQDAAYMDVVNRGDMETAQRMVMDAFKAKFPNTKVVDENGNPLVVYRASSLGGNGDYTVFDESKGGNYRGFYFTNRESAERNYSGRNLRAFFLNSTNPDTSNNFNVLQGDKNELPNNDGMIYAPDGVDADTFEVKVFNPSQIKSADPVTYDDQGNVIPLSERFNEEDDDIRFREGDTYEGSHIRVPSVKPSDVPVGYDEDGDYFIRWHKIIDPKIYAQAILDRASENYISKDDIRIIDDAIADIDDEIKEHEEIWARLDKEETKGLLKTIDKNSSMRYHERKLKMLKKAKEILNSLKSNNNPTNPTQPNNPTPTPPTPTPPSNPNPPTPPAQPQQPNNPVGRNGRNKIADEYNRETGANVSGVNGVKRGWEKFARDMFDGLRPLEQMQKLIEKALGRKLRDSEKAYELATQLTSKTGQQIEREQLSYMVPVLQQVTDVIKALKDADGYSRDEAYEKVTNYMLAKHGLERNEWFEKQGKDEGDYAGLRGLAERLGYNPDDYKTAAEVTVKDMEDTMKAAGIDVNEFWKTVNALTNRMLEISYESWMIDKDTFEDLKKRHKYYVPLRGFAEGTAADLFDYVTQSPHFQNIFQKATGRESMADDPLANLMSMLQSSIVIGNQNQVMQKIYNLAVNSNSDLLRVTKPWYVYNDATNTWEEKYPDIPEDATADEIDAIVKQFDADMAKLKANGKAKRKYNRIDVGKKLLRYQAKEHEMVAYIDGQRVLMHVAGNPLVAQSMNRMNTQHLNKVMQGIQAVTRWYSAINTSWSPAFGPKNAARDIRMMLFGAYTTGGIKKMWQSARDIVKAGWTLPRLLITGKMDGGLVKALGKQKAAQLEQWWNEFLDNGGETGFTRTLNAEKAKGEVKDMIRHMLNGSKDGENRVRKYTIGLIEWIGRYSEDISRFAAYCQQRAQGESVLSSIQEAKNVTVNFNVKGGSDLAANMRALYSFFNASMQGINRMRRLATEHPGRFSAGIATLMLGGAVLPWLNMAMFAMLGGDDDDWRKYEELTEYTANHNMILYVGNHKFVSIPWSQELAPFNALGNIWFRQQMGWNKGRSVAEQWGDMFVDLSPISVASGNKPGVGLVKTVMPSFTTPIWESLFNEDFTGSPLYKDNQWNKYDAAWKKAYTGKTSQSVIDASRWLNEKADIDINPAIAEHLFSGVLGGMGRSGDKLLRFFTNGFQLQDAPFIRTMMFDSNPKGYIGAVQREYGRNAYDVLDKVKNDVDDMDAMEFAQFSQTEEFEIANLVSVYKTGKDLAGNKKGIVGIDAMEKEYKKIAGASDGSEEYREQLEEIRNAITERKMEMLDEIQQIKYEHSGYLRKRIIEYVNEVEQESKEKNARKNGKEK